MRAIDANALEELFREVIGGIAKKPEIDGNLEHMVRASAMVVEMIKDAPTIEFGQRWIPCSERLPEEDYCTGRGIQHSESVLVTIVHHANDDDVFVDMACTVDGKWQLTYPFDDDPDIPKWCEIIAWMPLPEPYAERRTDDESI